MNHIIPSLFLATAIVAPCFAATSPTHLTGKTVVLNYTKAQYYSQMISDGSDAKGWTPYAVAKKNRNSGAWAFYDLGLAPKATRNILPITRPGQGGKYTYSKTGAQTGTIEVNTGNDSGRTITIQFTSATTGVATEQADAGDFEGTCRNIMVTIK